MTSKIDEEVAKFDNLAHNWWNVNEGEFRLLHQINPLRIEFILKHLKSHFKIKASDLPLAGLSVLDIGCGGGLATVSMARLGSMATGIDPSIKAVDNANAKATSLKLTNIEYICTTLEDFKTIDKFDVVLCLDVLEHVSDLGATVSTIARSLKPGGAVIISTINKTFQAFLQAIVAAEYILQMLPRATHHYAKFVKPSVLQNEFSKYDLSIKYISGITFLPLRQKWLLSKNSNVNYLAYIS
jgi:2-polyprenyl-6-hydroxyphenyl methylase/3-demethylubiquinone-9 3-methyltransferase